MLNRFLVWIDRRARFLAAIFFALFLVTLGVIYYSLELRNQPPRWLWQVVALHDPVLGVAAGEGKIVFDVPCEAWKSEPTFQLAPHFYARFIFDVNVRTGRLRVDRWSIPADPNWRCPSTLPEPPKPATTKTPATNPPKPPPASNPPNQVKK